MVKKNYSEENEKYETRWKAFPAENILFIIFLNWLIVSPRGYSLTRRCVPALRLKKKL